MDLAERGMSLALGALRRAGGLELLDRFGWREPAERFVHRATRDTMRAAGAATRTFSAVTQRTSPARQEPRPARRRFDLTPTEEQQMLQKAFGEFAAERLRPVARDADDACAPPAGLLEESAQLGTLLLSVPTDLGGVVDERSSVTAVLAAEALAHGDLSLAVACLAPASVATALSLWGDADQQSTYLTELTGESPPATAFALAEPRPLFDPTALTTTARVDGGDLVIDGEKSLVPLAATAELFLVAVSVDGTSTLVLVRSDSDGLTVSPEPAMGLRAAATGRLHLDGVRVPRADVVGDGDADVYRDALHRSRLAWSALAVGTSQAVLDHVTPYVNERHAFGEPISHRQSVAFAVSDIAIELEGMRLATYRAAALADRGEDLAEATAVAHHLCTTKGVEIGSQGVQLLGGHGYVKEHPVERWYRDLRALGAVSGGLLL